jgi:glyoxylase-like metal-dependent hydrolase (beta-lactamase superfamily II)
MAGKDGSPEMKALDRPRAVLLKPGRIERDEEGNVLDASSSVTLIIAGSRKIVVDTGKEEDGGVLREMLEHQGLSPDDVEIVINTHDHPDHSGNNRLFPRAIVLSGEAEGQDRLKEGDLVAPGVWIMETPGHTRGSISVVCESERRIVMAGDALPLLGNYLKWVPPRLTVDGDLAIKSMARIIGLADLVVPGHDLPFLVREGRRVFSLD